MQAYDVAPKTSFSTTEESVWLVGIFSYNCKSPCLTSVIYGSQILQNAIG